MAKIAYLDGQSLDVTTLVAIGYRGDSVDLTPEAWARVAESRAVIDGIVVPTYGVNTGFGYNAHVIISPEKLELLQENLIRSHAAGVGSPLTPERTRMLLALRINVLAKGHSGIRVETLKQLVAALNANCLSWVPEQGTVGASGDLAPLSHLALGMIGMGQMWDPDTKSYRPAAEVLAAHHLTPVKLQAKEGLAMINGTQFITSLTAEATERAARLLRQADVVAAMTLEALKGTKRAFDTRIHQARPHHGQACVAARMRALLDYGGRFKSEIMESHKNCGRVQDSYTLRCIPQVHGIANDTVNFVRGLLDTEMNSATDNPMVFAEEKEIVSGGNFHGEYPAKAADYLGIGINEIANMSERRIERLVNPALSEGLPAFLVKEGGLNSGFMIAHCTAAAMCSENKVLCHPASCDTISTSAAKEDHVSMGGFAARKALQIVQNVETVVAIELLSACQGIDFLRPLRSTEPLEAVHKLVRSVAAHWSADDRAMAPDIEAVAKLLRENKVWEAVVPFFRPEDMQTLTYP